MKILGVLALVVGAAFACGGDEPQDMIDAPPASRACDGRAYDKCADTTNSSDCDTGLTCRFYGTQNFTICSPMCDASTACPPDENGTAVSCNTMGRCRSSAPNNCNL